MADQQNFAFRESGRGIWRLGSLLRKKAERVGCQNTVNVSEKEKNQSGIGPTATCYPKLKSIRDVHRAWIQNSRALKQKNKRDN